MHVKLRILSCIDMVWFCVVSLQEKMPARDTGASRNSGVNLYIKNLAARMLLIANSWESRTSRPTMTRCGSSSNPSALSPRCAP